jgi:hypothetical protein
LCFCLLFFLLTLCSPLLFTPPFPLVRQSLWWRIEDSASFSFQIWVWVFALCVAFSLLVFSGFFLVFPPVVFLVSVPCYSFSNSFSVSSVLPPVFALVSGLIFSSVPLLLLSSPPLLGFAWVFVPGFFIQSLLFFLFLG